MRASRRIPLLATALTLTFLATGCSAEAGTAGTAQPGHVANESSADGNTAPTPTDAEGAADSKALELLNEALTSPDDKDERILDTDDDTVLQIVEQTLQSSNAKAAWNGSELLVTMDGSSTAPTAYSPCLALQAFLKGDEEAVIRYADGEIRCSDR